MYANENRRTKLSSLDCVPGPRNNPGCTPMGFQVRKMESELHRSARSRSIIFVTSRGHALAGYDSYRCVVADGAFSLSLIDLNYRFSRRRRGNLPSHTSSHYHVTNAINLAADVLTNERLLIHRINLHGLK